jgi:uncharacterized protein (TIGR02246 family)
MKPYLRFASIITIALLIANCPAAAGAPAPADGAAAIKTLLAAHIAALAAGDPAAFSAAFADSAVMMPPDRAAMKGKEAIRWGLRLAFAQFSAKINGESVEVEVAGDWAFARRTYMLTLTAKTGGEQMELTANWLDVLKRQPDGSWKIHFEMVTSDRPLPVLNP